MQFFLLMHQFEITKPTNLNSGYSQGGSYKKNASYFMMPLIYILHVKTIFQRRIILSNKPKAIASILTMVIWTNHCNIGNIGDTFAQPSSQHYNITPCIPHTWSLNMISVLHDSY